MQSESVRVQQSDGDADLDGILALQRANLRAVVPVEEARRQGFVTAEHTRDLLARMHALQPSIVARAGADVVGYALSMPLACRSFLPVLEPMFALIETLDYGGRPLLSRDLYVMGQICIAATHRGEGLFDALYAEHRRQFAARYELLVTEISAQNARSLRAHERVGFAPLTRYRDQTDEWVVVVLPLRGG